MQTVSFGQALLLLIENHGHDPKITDKLRKMYLRGVQDPSEIKEVYTLFLKCGLSDKYEISCDPDVINEDPSRRYFETHLAFETLSNSLNDLPLEILQLYFDRLHDTLIDEWRDKFDAYLNGSRSSSDNKFAEEYVDAFEKVQTNETYDLLSAQQKQKIILLLKCSWLAVMHAEAKLVPLNIYGTGFFAEQNRGRIAKVNAGTLSSQYCADKIPYFSQHFGLMKSYMPVPRDDISYMSKGFGFIKPVDQNSFNPEAEWPKLNFSGLVHPFSCSISGTLLCQFRFMKKLQNNSELMFDDSSKLTILLKCLTSALLFNSGGHSYNEFFAVLQLREIREAFAFINGFDQIDCLSTLYTGNEVAFDKALEDTVKFNHCILAKEAFHLKLQNL